MNIAFKLVLSLTVLVITASCAKRQKDPFELYKESLLQAPVTIVDSIDNIYVEGIKKAKRSRGASIRLIPDDKLLKKLDGCEVVMVFNIDQSNNRINNPHYFTTDGCTPVAAMYGSKLYLWRFEPFDDNPEALYFYTLRFDYDNVVTDKIRR